MNYDNAIRKVGNRLIQDYKSCGHVIPGINGPYDDHETEVRNLCHLSIIVVIEILLFRKEEYIELIKKMGMQILSFGENGIYKLRDKEGKDYCNGVIGHSWIIEALVHIYKVTGNQLYIDNAAQIAYTHRYDERIGLWRTPALTGSEEIDYTLNHQLCFAASLLELNMYLRDERIENMLNRFMDELHKNIGINRHGRICHGIIRRLNKKDTIKVMLKNIIEHFFEVIHISSMRYKEDGYHIFNLNAMARMYKCNKEYTFFESWKFLKTIDFLNSGECRRGLYSSDVNKDRSLHNNITDIFEKEINIYGYPYNVPGFEILYISGIWKNIISKDEVLVFLKDQFDFTYDFEKKIFGKRCHDKNTINYRVYEYYRAMEILYE